MAKESAKQISTYTTQAMRNIDFKLSKHDLILSGDQRVVVMTEIQQAIKNLLAKRKPKNPQSDKVQQRIELEAAAVFQAIQQILTEQDPPALTGVISETVRNEVVRAVGLRIAGVGNLPEDVTRLKKADHEFDPKMMAEALIASGEKRQVATGAIGQLITAGIKTHDALRGFLLRVLMCTDAQGVFSVEKYKKMEPYPKGKMGVQTLNLLLQYSLARKLLRLRNMKKITAIEEVQVGGDASDESDDF